MSLEERKITEADVDQQATAARRAEMTAKMEDA